VFAELVALISFRKPVHMQNATYQNDKIILGSGRY